LSDTTVLICPFIDLIRLEDSEAIETATELAAQNLFAMI